jgi:hypothetical protein
MATRTSSQGGNWSSTSTWGGEAVPANGDAVIISTGHDVVFDVDQSGFANGLLSLQIDGKLFFKHDIVTYLKMNGNVTGTGELWVGTEDNPIQRPAVGSENRCTLFFNATGTINVPTIRMYGWYPEREYTQLDADAGVGSNQIVLKEDLGLQQGDKIFIESPLEYAIAEAGKGVYTIQSYNSENKIATLTTPILYERPNGSYVAWESRPINLRRISGTGLLIPNTYDNHEFIGIKTFNVMISTAMSNATRVATNYKFKHCTNNGAYLVGSTINVLIEDSIGIGNTVGAYLTDSNINRCIMTSNMISNNNNLTTLIKDCIGLNAWGIGRGGYFKNCVAITALVATGGYITDMAPSIFEDCIIRLGDNTFGSKQSDSLIIFKNCLFKPNNIGYFGASSGKLYNCLFEGDIEINTNNFMGRNINNPLESFDHNQIPGNYKAWCKGGRIETEDGKLKFICESNDYPVFKDYPILAPANRTIKRLIGLTKSTPEIVTKLQFIDPTNDPLIDSSATPLAESSEVVNNQIGVAYKSDTPKQIILRIQCQNSTGEVLVDTTRIDQSLAKRIK